MNSKQVDKEVGMRPFRTGDIILHLLLMALSFVLTCIVTYWAWSERYQDHGLLAACISLVVAAGICILSVLLITFLSYRLTIYLCNGGFEEDEPPALSGSQNAPEKKRAD